MLEASVHLHSEMTFYYLLCDDLINADSCAEEVRLLQSYCSCGDSGCKAYQAQKEKEFEIGI